MSTVADFNRIEDCNKIDPLCIDAYTDLELDPDNETGIHLSTPWGDIHLDLEDAIKAGQTCTTLYLSPEDNPNCLVYEPECGDNICIRGDDLSRIISMRHLKDVAQTTPANGDVYMYNSTTGLWETFDLRSILTSLNSSVQNAVNAVSNISGRMTAIEAKLVPPADAPTDVKVVFGNTNIYADTNAVINSSGEATTLDKTHGLYTHTLATDTYGDQIFG